MTELHQRTIDEISRARRTDPETSKDAARRAGGLAAEHQRIILAVMQGTRPALDWTADEIAQWCDLDRHQIGRRLGEMLVRGLIRKTSNTRPTPTGRAAQCYEVVADNMEEQK